MIEVTTQPGGERFTFERLNTVTQLLGKLGLKYTRVIVIRGDELLTQDRRIQRGDRLVVRHVVSRG